MPKIVIDDFRGGRNTNDAVNLVANNQHAVGNNVWVETRALAKRRGFTVQSISLNSLTPIPENLYTSHLASSSLLRLMIAGRVSAHSQKYLLYTDNGTSFSWAGYVTGTVSVTGATVTGSGTAWSTNVTAGDRFMVNAEATFTEISTVDSDTQLTLTANYPANYSAGSAYTVIQQITQGRPTSMASFDVSGAQNIFVVDGTRGYRYNGTTTVIVAAVPAFRYIIAFKNYLFGLGHNTTDVRWSALRDAATWNSNNFQQVGTVGNPTRGFAIYEDSLIIFTRRGMYRLVGDVFDPSNPTYVLQPISVPVNFNFTFPRTAVTHQGILKFLTADGWFAYTGGDSIQKISLVVQADVDGFRRLAFASEAMQDSAVAFVHNDRMWCSVPDNDETPADTLNTIYVQDERGAWWKWDMSQQSAAGEVCDFALVQYTSGGTYSLAAGNVGTTSLTTLDTGSADNTAAINGSWTSREFVFDDDVEFSEIRVTLATQSAGNLVVGFSIDRATVVNTNAPMTGGVGTVSRRAIPVRRIGKAIRVTVSNNTADQTFEVYKIEIFFNESDAQRA
ncbi:MAG: hypothetical protein QME66_05800 [Candidatus Eisenbacteria bacterium]|nr:hypothetical protein [Candidatus Eisenbacteria bacterium]